MAVDNAIPPAGTPGVFDARNPTLLPNFDKPVTNTNGGGTLSLSSPAGFLVANPRVAASATATFGGSATSADELTIELTNPALVAQGASGGKISHSYTVGGSDGLDDIAAGFADLFNDDAICQSADIRCDATGAVLTFYQSGPVGNFATLTAPVEEPAKITVGGTSHTGDVFNVLFTGPALPVGGVLVQANSTTTNTPTQDAAALNAAINANATLSGASISSSPTAAVLAITLPAGDYNVVAWVNSAAPTWTAAGTIAAGNTVTATVTNALLPGGSHAVVYTALLGDDATAIATGVKNLINADPVFIAANMTATSASAVVTLHYPSAGGQVRISSSATGGGATLTSLAAPTATAVVGTTATETITFSNSGALSGGDGPIIATNNFEFSAPATSQVQAFFYGTPYLLGYDLVSAMVSQGMPVI